MNTLKKVNKLNCKTNKTAVTALNTLPIKAIKLLFFYFCMMMLSFFTLKKAAAQEIITPLNNNQVIIRHLEDKPVIMFKHGVIDTLNLPFFDDFTGAHIYPDHSKWIDQNVFINNNFPHLPISANVATFDGLNQYGNPYVVNFPDEATAGADTLTSMPIDLSSYFNNDSVYLSFFYQPQGLGDAPEPKDSFVLEFKPDSVWTGTAWDTNRWIRVWSVPGSARQPFRAVIIPVLNNGSDFNYFHNSFQFRFVNYGNLSGSLDHWHLDYVMLDHGRNHNDTIFTDVTMVRPVHSILRNYHSMPWDQFMVSPNQEIAQRVEIPFRNLSNLPRTVRYGYEIRDLSNNNVIVSTLGGAADQANPFSIVFQDTTLQFNHNLIAAADTVRLLVTTAASTTPDDFVTNDTVTHTQVFEKHLAYDDGSAEAGYGIINTNSGKVAIRFNLNKPDSLKAIAIHFNQSREDVGFRLFTLTVWKQLSPLGQYDDFDEVIYRQFDLNPVYTNTINGFHYYMLDTALFLDGVFYIGWEQNNQFNLNVGYDVNYDRITGGGPNPNLFFNVQGVWRASQNPGAPMIRPVFGEPVFTGIKKPQTIVSNFKIFPNPASNIINIQLYNSGIHNLVILDITGKKVFETEIYDHKQLNLPALTSGLYLVKITDLKTGTSGMQKLILK